MSTDTTIAVAMFAIADQDDAVAFYTTTLGWEVRSDVSWGEGDTAGRWVEVAPPASTARLALNPPMNGEPGGGSIGVETDDLAAEKSRIQAAGIEIVNEMPGGGPVPAMFAINDPDGNWIWVAQAGAM
ncbi:MAG: VOC family protein [Nocardioidaceae bacterium]|nr:VOC family protein [Nocardioidaceae bacterium]